MAYQKSNNETLTGDQVAQFLLDNPGFLNENDELLRQLQVRHAAGAAQSLIERQVALLRSHNEGLQQQLDELVAEGRRNDRLFAQLRELVLSLLQAADLSQLAERLRRSLTRHFDADLCALTLFDLPESQRCAQISQVARADAEQAIGGIVNNRGALCGSFRPRELSFIFPEQPAQVRSAAVTPLGDEQVLGVLAVGSFNPSHFQSSMGTMFLGYVADIVNLMLPRLIR